jgi:indolepyruvate ferredoxin oxidoreductase beta subunit
VNTTNLLLAGVGGQGVLLASEVLSEAAFLQGFDVKKSEVHGMSQRGGGVTSHLRFGDRVYSPLIPTGQADYLVSFHVEEGAKYEFMLKPEGRKIGPEMAGVELEGLGRSLNIYLLGALSEALPIEAENWRKALEHCIKPRFLEVNLKAFERGRNCPWMEKLTK